MEHQEGDAVVLNRAGAISHILILIRFTCCAEGTGYAIGVNNHDDRAVTKNGISGEHADIAQLLAHRLDNDFFRVEDAIDNDPEIAIADLGDHDEAFAIRRRFFGLDSQ